MDSKWRLINSKLGKSEDSETTKTVTSSDLGIVKRSFSKNEWKASISGKFSLKFSLIASELQASNEFPSLEICGLLISSIFL